MVKTIAKHLKDRNKISAADTICKKVFKERLYWDVGFFVDGSGHYIELCDSETNKTVMTFTSESVEQLLVDFYTIFYPEETTKALDSVIEDEAIQDLLK